MIFSWTHLWDVEPGGVGAGGTPLKQLIGPIAHLLCVNFSKQDDFCHSM